MWNGFMKYGRLSSLINDHVKATVHPSKLFRDTFTYTFNKFNKYFIDIFDLCSLSIMTW